MLHFSGGMLHGYRDYEVTHYAILLGPDIGQPVLKSDGIDAFLEVGEGSRLNGFGWSRAKTLSCESCKVPF